MKKKTEKKSGKIINGILYTLLGIILIINLFILFQAKTNDDKVPAIFGYKPFIVMSGSMESEIWTGDLIFVKKVDGNSLEVNDIVAFRTEDNAVVTHRIVKKYNAAEVKYATKGDNNDSDDVDLVNASDIEGKYVGRIPKVGSWLLFISKPIGMVIAVLVAVVIIFIYAFTNILQENNHKSKEDEAYRKEFEEFKKNNPHKE